MLGLGRTGLAACQSLTGSGATVLAWDDAADARDAAARSGIALFDLNDPNVWKSVASLIVSPGIPHLYPAPNPIVAAASRAGVPLDNGHRTVSPDDTGLQDGACCDCCDRIERKINNLGADGIYFPVRRKKIAGCQAISAMRCLGWTSSERTDLSCLKCRRTRPNSPAASTPMPRCFLNLASDHLDRHGGLGGYFAAKRRLFNRKKRHCFGHRRGRI